MYNKDDFLMLSGIQHFKFCRRQWALIHIEQQWSENLRTVDGNIMHERAHDKLFSEKRGDVIITRGMPVSSNTLGISGECDVVEFVQDENGINIVGHDEKYRVYPVEYKKGNPKADDEDVLQLVAQAMCLEEMLCVNISDGALFYGETKKRVIVEITDELREEVKSLVTEMHQLYDRRYTPKVKRKKACNACSLKDICLPVLNSPKTAGKYIKNMMEDD